MNENLNETTRVANGQASNFTTRKRPVHRLPLRGEWPSGLYSLRQVAEVKLGRVRSDFGWVTTEA